MSPTVLNVPTHVLSPDEFDQAQTMAPSQVTADAFPGGSDPIKPLTGPVKPPPFAPKDATAASDPNAPTDHGTPLTGMARILTQYVAAPIMDHPLTSTVAAVTPGAGYVMSGLMVKDIAEFAMQKHAESQLTPDERAIAENAPGRIPGERVAVEAAMLGLAPLVRTSLKSLKAVTEGGAASPEMNPAPDPGRIVDGVRQPPATPLTGGASPAGLTGLRSADAAGLAASPTPSDKAQVAPTGDERPSVTLGDVMRRPSGQLMRLQAAATQHATAVGDAWSTIFAPTGRSPEAAQAASILRSSTGHMAADYEQAAYKLDEFRRAIDPLPDADKLGFIDAIEGGRSQASPEFQSAADLMRKTLDDARDQVRALGTGKLESFITNYFPHIWDDPDRAADAFRGALGPESDASASALASQSGGAAPRDALQQAKNMMGGKRPMEGSKSFLKQRTIPTTLAGMQMGLTPVTTNPVDLTLLKLREMQRYVMAHRSLNEMKDANIVQYVGAGQMPPDGYQRIDDRIATVFGPRKGAVTLPDQPGAAADALNNMRESGFASTPAGSVSVPVGQRFAEATSPENTTAVMKRAIAKVGASEFQRLASSELNTRAISDPADVQGATEETARRIVSGELTPNTPGQSTINPDDVLVHGTRIMGQYYAPEPVSTVVNNYLSPGLRGNAIYDAYRGLGNSLNQAQLGFSAFHLGMTSLDATVSRAALGIEHLAAGRPLDALGSFISAPTAPLPGLVQGLGGDLINHFFGTDIQLGLGAKIRQAYLHPETASDDMIALANAVKEGGGRIRQDSFYENSAPQRFTQALKAGQPFKAAALSIPALLEASAKPIMEHVVPLQKLGVFGDMAKQVLADLPETATLADRRAALGEAWNSVDNRMGQLVYDNLFWNKTVKDLSMASVRSVGWNLGTIRELGGGMTDLATGFNEMTKGAMSPADAMTHRAAYALALPIVVGMYNATYQYLRTGQGPTELKDYGYPKTGDVDADGNPERMQMPSYTKDMMAYGTHPWETVKHKISPQLASVVEMLDNKDYYGDQIRNADDPLVQQFMQEAQYVAKTAMPFAFSNMRESGKRGDNLTTRAGEFFGITPAPRAIVRSDAQNLMAKYLDESQPSGGTPEEADARRSRSDLLGAMRTNDGSPQAAQGIQDAVTDAIERHQLTAKDVVQLLRRAGTTPAAEKFKSLTLPQALDVFKASTPGEKAKFAHALMSKIDRAIARGDPIASGPRTDTDTASATARAGYQGATRSPISAKAAAGLPVITP